MKPRVLHVVDTFGARSETFIYAYVTAHRQFEAAVACRTRQNEAEFPFDRVTSVRDPYSRRSPWHWASRGLAATTGRSLWDRGVANEIARWRPAVVHAHFGQVGVSALAALDGTDVPLVTSFYGYDAGVLGRDPDWRRRFHALFARAAAILVEGPAMREKLLALGAIPDRLHLQHIAIDVGRYPAWSPDPVPTALFVGRFVDKKGLDDAVEAVARARERLPALRFRLVGDGPGRPRLERRIAELGLGDVVTLLGMQPHPVVIQELRRCAVFLHPSCTTADGDTEGGAPTVLLEAQAIGAPIVSTTHADIPYVTQGAAGVWLASERDVPAIAAGVVAAVASGRPSSADRVWEHHDIRNQIDRLEALYAVAAQAA